MLVDQPPCPRAPSFVQTAADTGRWELCVAIAARAFGELPLSRDVQAAARVLFFSDHPTADEAD